MALIENLQREDLNPIDEALAYRRLSDEFQLTQDAIAIAVGKDRATVANTVRLLKLPQEVKSEVGAGRLSMGHARALAVADGRGRAATDCARHPVAQSVGSRDGIGRQKDHRRQPSRAGCSAKARSTSTLARPRIVSSCSSARASESSDAARADASRSTSRPRTN